MTPGKTTIVLVSGFFLIITVVFNYGIPLVNQYSYLAHAFLNGSLSFLTTPGRSWEDTVFVSGWHFWPLGPFPAILLMPGIWLFGLGSSQLVVATVNVILVLTVFFSVFAIARKTGYSQNDSLYFAFAFCFASAFIGVAFMPSSWYIAHTVSVALSLLALLEFLTKRRLLLVGSLIAMTLATRLTTAIPILFFLLSITFSKKSLEVRVKRSMMLLAPPGIMLLVLGWYNYARFENVLEQGYALQILNPAVQRMRAGGLLNLKHVPVNLYYLLINIPLPIPGEKRGVDLWGMSMFVTSPYLVSMFFLKYRDTVSRLLAITIITTAIPILLYYGIGWVQFGYRYALDFFPFLFYLFLRNYRSKYGSLSKSMKALFLVSGFVNVYLFGLFYNAYVGT